LKLKDFEEHSSTLKNLQHFEEVSSTPPTHLEKLQAPFNNSKNFLFHTLSQTSTLKTSKKLEELSFTLLNLKLET
jgi:hypothetical protein